MASTSASCCPGSSRPRASRRPSCCANLLTRCLVSTPEVVAEAIFEAGTGWEPERYVPRYYWIAAARASLAPGVVRRAVATGRSRPSTTPGLTASALRTCSAMPTLV